MADDEQVEEEPSEEELLRSSFDVFSAQNPRLGDMREAVLTFRHETRRWSDLPAETFVRAALSSVGPGACISVMVMKHHRLESLPLDFHEIGSHMLHLNLSYNRIQSFLLPNPSKFLLLNELLLVGNGLETLDSDLGHLPCLKVLDVSNNSLTELPLCVTRLSSLTVLNVSFNKLTTICGEIGQLKHLEELELQNNQLEELPDEFGHLNLNCLHLSCNLLTSNVMKVISQITSLQELYFAQNRIKQIPLEFLCLSNLKRVVTNGNPLSFPPMRCCRQGLTEIKAFLEKKLDKCKTENICHGNVHVVRNPYYADTDSEGDYQTDSD